MRPLRVNGLEVRLAQTAREVDASQGLRYRVFYEEMGAKPSAFLAACRRDVDRYDERCDHLLVIDTERGTAKDPSVVGSYRLLKGEVAETHDGFYSQNEFDLTQLVRGREDILELGRSCIDSDYRSRGTIQLLWRGLAQYIFDQGVRYLFGCASFPGTDPDEVKLPLSYLYHHHLAPTKIRTRARTKHSVEMNMMDKDTIDARQAFRELPPLIKGYLRVGCVVGDGAVIDHQFNTIMTNIVIDTQAITRKYLDHYTPQADSFAPHNPAEPVMTTPEPLAPCV
ncbi:GNAT family N-acyltransferase [Magnetovibrio sp. PR-2]|uniref:GNAT family N-acetyltransferase n=1 Tax=Magnetovibrio sp. PR-2 TaxID=3120356 RepID=UPI002FCE4BDA